MPEQDLIAEAITEAFGERCPDVAEGCACCDAWKQYDDLLAKSERLAAERDAAEFAARNGRSLAEDSIYAIRELLREAGVPTAAFIDDHVANAIMQRNEESKRADTAVARLLALEANALTGGKF